MTVLPLRTRDAGPTVFLNERFVSVQGEGPLAGQRCAFVRLSYCNLACGWCDTEESWNFAKYDRDKISSRVPVAEVADWVAAQDMNLVVVTGGEPLLQQQAMRALVTGVTRGMRIQVETNGTKAPSAELAERVDLWVVSPKLENSGMAYDDRIKPAALAAMSATGRAVFKFVVTEPDHDMDEIAELVEAWSLTPVWVMPEGRTPEAVLAGLRGIAGAAVERGWNVSSRLHILCGAR